jgi:hypothetical protein
VTPKTLGDACCLRGRPQETNHVLLSKETCEDPAYLPMRLKRIAIAGLPPGEADVARKACGVK